MAICPDMLSRDQKSAYLKYTHRTNSMCPKQIHQGCDVRGFIRISRTLMEKSRGACRSPQISKAFLPQWPSSIDQQPRKNPSFVVTFSGCVSYPEKYPGLIPSICSPLLSLDGTTFSRFAEALDKEFMACRKNVYPVSLFIPDHNHRGSHKSARCDSSYRPS
jgi:hypothetical protein